MQAPSYYLYKKLEWRTIAPYLTSHKTHRYEARPKLGW